MALLIGLGIGLLARPKTVTTQNITQVDNKTIINKNYIDSLSTNINKQVSTTILNDAKLCSADINNNQAITINKFTTTGNFNFNSKQTQSAALTFSCVQATMVRNRAKTDIISMMANSLATNASSVALSQLESKAEQATKTSFGAVGSVESNQNINQTTNYVNENETYKNIKNVLNNIVENNFSSETISKCISQVNNSNSVNIEEIKVDGKAVIAIEQNQATDVITDCVQKSDIGGDIINSVVTVFDVKVKDETYSKTTTEQKSDATQTTTAGGLGLNFPGMALSIISCIILLSGCAYVAKEFASSTQVKIISALIAIAAVVAGCIYIYLRFIKK